MTNSPVSRMMSWEYRSGRTDMETMGGFVFTIPVHATVKTLTFFGFSPSVQVTITTGKGAIIVVGDITLYFSFIVSTPSAKV